MKKLSNLIIILPLALLILSVAAHASGQDMTADQAEALDSGRVEQALTPEARRMLGGVDSTSVNVDQALSGLMRTINAQTGGIFADAMRSAVMLLIIAALCAVASAFRETGAKSSPSFVSVAGVLGICAVVAGDVNGLMSVGNSVISSMDTFSKTLLPTLAAAVASTGAPMAAAARHTATMLFSDVLLSVISRFYVPLVYTYIAVSAANAAVGNNVLAKMCAFIKWVCVCSLSLMLTGFISYLTITGIISGSADALAVKGAKFAISNFVPVVGGIVSDAAETVLTSAGILKNSIGVFGMIAVVATCVIPFLQLGARYIVFKLAAALAGTLNDDSLSDFIDKAADFLGGDVLGLLGGFL